MESSSRIIRGFKTFNHLLRRKSKHVSLIVRLLPMKVGWWHAPLVLWDFAEEIFIILTMGGSLFFSRGVSWSSSSCPSCIYTRLCFPSDSERIHYQEFPPNYNSPPSRTYSAVSTLSAILIWFHLIFLIKSVFIYLHLKFPKLVSQ